MASFRNGRTHRNNKHRQLLVALVALTFVVAACSSSSTDAAGDSPSSDADTDADAEPSGPFVVDAANLPTDPGRDFGPAPDVPSGDLSAETIEKLNAVFGDNLAEGRFGAEEIDIIGELGSIEDPRIAWLFSDLLRISQGQALRSTLISASGQATGASIDAGSPWLDLTDRLIAWDIPAPPNYLEWKSNIYTVVVADWEPLFDPNATEIDWRYVSWGGVGIDDREFASDDQFDPRCNCIPAIDNPEVTDVDGAGWLDDDDVVFGITLNGESRAYPRSAMEVREMVNDTLGGRDLGIPYCTLCGSAQAFFTDDVPDGVDRPILRTSGLLSRSNKVMYDLNTKSVFDTFLGNAVTGPLSDIGVTLPQASVLTTTWGEWREAHPDTTVLAEGLNLGRDPDFRNNRDANGPIFPVGEVDPRLAVQEDIVGVTTPSGNALAFHSATARAALLDGQTVSADGVELRLVGGGLQAFTTDGEPIASHEAFWFAWSQFHPDTDLWPV